MTAVTGDQNRKPDSVIYYLVAVGYSVATVSKIFISFVGRLLLSFGERQERKSFQAVANRFG